MMMMRRGRVADWRKNCRLNNGAVQISGMKFDRSSFVLHIINLTAADADDRESKCTNIQLGKFGPL